MNLLKCNLRPPATLSEFRLRLKIWLSISIFVLGFLFTTILDNWQQRTTERNLHRCSVALFPDARDAHAGLAVLEQRSARMRIVRLLVFLVTLVVAAVLVNLTISRVILTPLLRAQSELAAERDMLRTLFDHLPDYIYFKDAQGRFVRINSAMTELLGLERPEQAYGRTDSDFFDAQLAREAEADEQRIFATGQPLVSRVERLQRPGISRWVMSTKIPVRDQHGQVRLIVGVSRDVTEWNDLLENLQYSEASFRMLFAAVPQAVWVCDLETLNFIEVNTAAVRQYGYTAAEFRKMRILDVYPAADHERLKKTLSSLDPANLPRGPRKHLTKDGRALDVEISVHLLDLHGRKAILITAQDLTAHRRLEIELRHAQRLEAVGQLAAGIAHEINTPIQYIGDNLRFLQDAFNGRQEAMRQYEQLRLDALAGSVHTAQLNALAEALDSGDMEYLADQIPKALTQSLEGVEHVAMIVRAMKSFAHPGQKQKAAADLNRAISDALLVARNEIKYVADVETAFGDIPPVVCHIADINQVLLNLLVNAAHAINDVFQQTRQRGLIRIETSRSDGQIVLSIADSGCGIPESIQARIFDPFFTTKDVGKGTGQGLAISRNVVERHGGKITFHPNSPRGTVFVVTLPLEPPQTGPAAERGEESTGAEESE